MITSIKTMMLLLAMSFLPGSLAWSVDYGVYNGFQEQDYDPMGKYMQWGLIDSFESIGLTKHAYEHSGRWQLLENSFVPDYWTYTSAKFDSSAVDYPDISAFFGPTGTFKDKASGDFYAILRSRYEWEGTNVITNDEMRLGEGNAYLRNDGYLGYCRYLMLVGGNSMAMGPAMSDNGQPTFSRPDLFSQTNGNHANPFKIWGPTMTNGVRIMMGFTDHVYWHGEADRSKWRKFGEYYGAGLSIVDSFFRMALEAHDYHKPVAMAQGNSAAECDRLLNLEHYFYTDRPRSGPYRYLALRWCCPSRVRNYDGYYIWSQKDGADMSGPEQLPATSEVYVSEDSAGAVDAALLKYMDAFGFTRSQELVFTSDRPGVYKVDEDRRISIDHRNGNLVYHDTSAYGSAPGPCQISADACADTALSFLVDNQIVKAGELVVDRLVAVNQVVVATEDLAAEKDQADPQVIRYIVVLKRNLGALPLLSSDVDTITVELGQAGGIVSLTSNYRYGLQVKAIETVKSLFSSVEEVQSVLSPLGAPSDVQAGMLPTEDGRYLPVYEVRMGSMDADGTQAPKVAFYRMDNLEQVFTDTLAPAKGYDLDEPELPSLLPGF